MTTTREREQRTHTYNVLQSLGFTYVECECLRRISMTLQRWFELECGNGNYYGSWAIERGEDGEGKPFMVHHHYRHGNGKDTVTRTPIPDREAGARKRLAAIIEARNTREREANPVTFAADVMPRQLVTYVQSDPRGAALYILRPGDVPAGQDVGAYYNRGICVY